MKNKGSLNQVKKFFPAGGHYELTRSDAAEKYCWKDETSLGQRFEFGKKVLRRNSSTDWEDVREKAKVGDLDSVPADIYIRYYRSLRTISMDHSKPVGISKTIYVLFGPTATGKSYRAWQRFPSAYSKDPRSKWWSGYRGEDVAIMDEFRGSIDISHLLRWFDCYPVSVETKGSQVPLCVSTVVITSNLPPKAWFPELDFPTYAALERRLTVFEVLDKEQEINF